MYYLCVTLNVLVILNAFVDNGDAVCSFPTGLQNNNWTSSGFGNMEFTVSNVTFTDDTPVSSTYTCHLNSGSSYVIRSPASVSLSVTVHYYYCFQLSQVTTYSFSYYLPTAPDFTGNRRKTFPNTTDVTSVNSVCDISAVVAELYVLVQRDSPSSAAANCTTPLLGNFRYTVTSSLGVSSCGTSPGDGYLGVCEGDSKTVVYNYTSCSTQLGYSTSGLLYCIASTSTTVGSTLTYYQILYNSDATTIRRFTCMALAYNSTDNSLVYASEIHTKCAENQNATTAPTGGNLIFFTANETCVPATSVVVEEDEGANIGLIVGLIVAGIIIIAVVAALLFYCLYWKNRDPNAGKPIVENTKPRFEDPDKEDIVEDIELEDTRSEPLTREDIVFTAESPSFIPNGNAHTANGHARGVASNTANDSVIPSTDYAKLGETQATPRLNRDRESMVIFNGDEKVISGNDSRVVQSENQSFRRFQPDISGSGPHGILTLEGLEDETGDGLGELSSHKDVPYPTLPREKSNLLPPIETIDPEKEN